MTSPTLNRPAQRRLPLQVDVDAPLVDIAFARAALGMDEDAILDLIEVRALAWAWDIASPGAGRREIRLLAKSVRGFQATGLKDNLGETPVAEIIGWILAREKKPWIDGTRLAQLLVCSPTHIYQLIAARLLSPLSTEVGLAVSASRGAQGTARPTWRRGPGGTVAVGIGSVVNFLTKRRIM